jgi:uncharacterized protein YceK
MKRLTFCLLLALLALSGCGGTSATRTDSGSTGATRTEQPSAAPETDSPWAKDPQFIAPPA